MKLLCDTHAILWFALNNHRLSRVALAQFETPENEIFVSPVNHWEIAIKIGLGKYRLEGDFLEVWAQVIKRFKQLTIEPRHTVRLIDLPYHHKDPFDRLLIAQRVVDDLTILGKDKVFDQYGVQRIW